jgi:hypothetical protein
VKEVRSTSLNELDGVAIRVRHPRYSEVIQEVVWWAERKGAFGGQARVVAVGVVRPENDLDRPSTEVRTQAVIGRRCLDRGDADYEPIKSHLDMDRRPLGGRPKRLLEAKARVEPDQSHDIAGVDVDRGVPKRGWRGLNQDSRSYHDRYPACCRT